MTVNERELYLKALRKWGIQAQLTMLIEECAELIHAACHFARSPLFSMEKLAEEAADVEIMLRQLRQFSPSLKSKIEKAVSTKLLRLAQRLNEEDLSR